jgi:hypothetical protein
VIGLESIVEVGVASIPVKRKFLPITLDITFAPLQQAIKNGAPQPSTVTATFSSLISIPLENGPISDKL